MTDSFTRATRQFLRRNWYEYFLTLNLNGEFSPKKRELLAKGLFRRIDRKLLGRNYMDKPTRRADFVIILEHPDSNAHFHCLGRFDPECDLSTRTLREMIGNEWKKLCKSGSIDLQRINRTRRRLAGYVTKSLTKNNWGDRVMTSREFWAAPKAERGQHLPARPRKKD
jgi:hypothetical protein